ncbi:AfsR/SARP family transcriptional regulator [Longispora fulva]|uniref:DNA-binding SARP family transcriptional activator/Tfp pilus assembly protein PilF n=1 Tax=Longispora fulva TaxID=619741 RepID=A0A8J7GHL1_9ACTN|nr:tetratricopeptide repeat protein [Longispora fulva]MBG6139299.1 DNA-binding SARP family transcriptional activator/Tfp pilus assembly protein PilF [Longispora fulva]
MELRVLGALEVRDGGLVSAPRRRLTRVLLGMLALRANLPLSTDAIMDALWGSAPPRSARANLRSYVAELRRLLPGALPADPRVEAVRRGYLLRVGTTGLDVLRFEALAAEGRQHLADGGYGLAADRLGHAAGLWRGPVLAGLDIPDAVAADARLLDDRRLDVTEHAIDARLALGQHADLAAQLPTLIAGHELRERRWGQLMLALYRCGRQAEALETYQRLYRLLADELGVEPGPESQELHGRILRSDPGLGADPLSPPAPAPWQLPPVPAGFVGRTAELALVDGAMRAAAGPRGPIAVTVLSGTAGVGKTALALHWAHRARERFPDGCLYVDLRGYGPDQPRLPEDVLVEFLSALGVESRRDLTGTYRTVLAGRRMLVVLDNAWSADQIRPLLPGDSCGVLVTSRDALAGLVARDGATRVDVELLPAGDAVDLLRGLIGGRADAEPGTAETLAHRCARLPLALRIAAELVVDSPATTLSELAGELADEQHRLDVLDAGGDAQTAVRSVLSWSDRHLSPGAARAFRLLGLHPGRHFDRYALAALADAPPRPLLGSLLRAHLVHEVSPGRYASHDLLRSYAHELAAGLDERHAALARLFDQQVYTASVAMDLVYPHEAHRRPKAVEPTVPTEAFADPDAARAWLDAELDNLLAVARLAADTGWGGPVATLSGTLHRHLSTRGRYVDMLALHDLALDVAREAADSRAESAALHDRGVALFRMGRFSDALDQLGRALAIRAENGDRIGESATLHRLGTVHSEAGRPHEALDHFHRALAVAGELGDVAAEGAVLGNIGLVHEWLGEWPDALDCYQRALAIHRATGFRTGEGDTLNNIAIVYRHSGRVPESVDHLEQALAVYRAAGDRGGVGVALNNLGLAAANRDDWAAGRIHLSEALAVHRELGSRVAELETLNILGLLEHREGRHADAVARFRGTVALAMDLGVPGSLMNAHQGLGLALEAVGQRGAALVHLEAALELARGTGARKAEATALLSVARCAPEPEATRLRALAAALHEALGLPPDP